MITNTIRLLLKIAAAILLLSAIWVFYTDTTTEAASMMFGRFWFDLSPTSLQVTEAVISRYIDPCGLFVRLGCSPFLWHPVISTTLQWPAVLVLAALSVICYMASRIGQKTRAPRRNNAYYKNGG
ncbi:MAG: hypothetical protein ACPHVM_07270 [Candidatus Puniceispirillaceae bacterium]